MILGRSLLPQGILSSSATLKQAMNRSIQLLSKASQKDQQTLSPSDPATLKMN